MSTNNMTNQQGDVEMGGFTQMYTVILQDQQGNTVKQGQMSSDDPRLLSNSQEIDEAQHEHCDLEAETLKVELLSAEIAKLNAEKELKVYVAKDKVLKQRIKGLEKTVTANQEALWHKPGVPMPQWPSQDDITQNAWYKAEAVRLRKALLQTRMEREKARLDNRTMRRMLAKAQPEAQFLYGVDANEDPTTSFLVGDLFDIIRSQQLKLAQQEDELEILRRHEMAGNPYWLEKAHRETARMQLEGEIRPEPAESLTPKIKVARAQMPGPQIDPGTIMTPVIRLVEVVPEQASGLPSAMDET